MQEVKKFLTKYHIRFFSIFVIFIFFYFLYRNATQFEQDFITLNDNWTLKINNQEISNNFVLDTNEFNTLKKGDKIEISRIIPNINYKNTTLLMQIEYTTLELYIDDILQYEYGLEEFKRNEMLLDAPTWIPLPNDISGKEIRIVMNVGENHAVSQINSISLGEYFTLYKNFIKTKTLTILVGSFLILFGMIILGILIRDKSSNYISKKAFYICMYAIFMGMFVLARENIFNIISNDFMLIKYIEYVTLYSIPIFILGFILDIKSKKTNEPLFPQKIMTIGVIGFMIILFTSFILQVFNIMHLKQTLIYYRTFVVIYAVLIIINLLKNITKSQQRDKKMLIAILVMVFCIILDIIAYNLNFIDTSIISFVIKNITPIGVMVLLIVLIHDFYDTILINTRKASQIDMLNKLAFIDILTKLKNRTWYEHFINNIQEVSYTFIAFDLNRLKETNDLYGHEKGDELIKGFANTLKEVFVNNAHSIRMGGDEFLVILEFIDEKETIRLLQILDKVINRKNEYLTNKISVAYGYATSIESITSSPSEVYKLADIRMYENKRKIKELKNSI